MLATTEITLRETALNPQTSNPQVAIVIPVYKHSVLVAEAITCALGQETKLTFVIILVNDGCKFQETDQVCREFALAYPEKITYLYRPNGGLSAARNTGIDFALQTWDAIAAIYLLDADNRISPHTIERSFNLLQNNPQVGWVYPTIDMFGKEEGEDFDYRGAYSKLRHTRFNTCEAGSMIRREVFDRGCRYDESMTLGFEDWEFWWQAIAAGYQGQHLPESGFQYRKRFESMLSDSHRDGEAIKHYMRQKNRDLFTHRQLLSWEHQEAPRYAIFAQDSEQVLLTSDPIVLGNSLNVEDWKDYYLRGQLMPFRYHRSHFLVFTSSKVLQILQEQGLSHWLFWQLENSLNQSNFASLTLTFNPESSKISINKEPQPSVFKLGQDNHLIMTTVEVMDQSLSNQEDNWILNLLNLDPLPKVFGLEMALPASMLPELPIGDALSSVLTTFRNLRCDLLQQTTDDAWDWHDNYLPPRSRMFEDLRLALNCGTAYPKLTNNGERHIGFILSILEFGGVEKVALNIACAFKETGWRVHLFVFDLQMQQLPSWAQVFDSINFYHEASMEPWLGLQYMGSKNDSWSVESEKLAAKGLLSWLDAAINFHSPTANSVMALLRRSGVKTLTSLHVHDLSASHRPVGHGYLTLGYEHAYDYVIPCSQNMANWCHSLGIPEEKIVKVQNACGYPLARTKVNQIITRRRARGFTGRLRVLFLGRFDRQKGLDRLLDLVKRSRKLELPIDWRLVGKNVFQEKKSLKKSPKRSSIREQLFSNKQTSVAALVNPLEEIIDLIEPPAFTTEELTELYEWADVLILPSYWEGLPLTILEAMRLGVVVVASDVGAIAEVVSHQSNGLMISDTDGSSFTDSVIAEFQQLIANPTELTRLSQAAAIAVEQLSWSNASADLISRLNHL